MIYCLPYHVNFVFVSLYLYLYLDIFVFAYWYLCICILIFLSLHRDIFVFVFWYLCISGWHEARLRFEFTAWRHLIWSQSVVKGATHLMLCTSVAYNVNLWGKIHQKHGKNYVIWAPRLRNLKNCLMGNSFSAPRDASNVCTYLLFYSCICIKIYLYSFVDILVFVFWYLAR